MTKLPICVILSGLLLLVAFTVLNWIVMPLFLGDKVVQGMRGFYGPFGSADHWKKFGLPTSLALDPPLLHVYFFNVTNPFEVVRNGIKPILNQVGPYTYMIDKVIEEIPGDENNTDGALKFRERNIYIFNPMQSAPFNDNDLVTVLNIPFLKMVDAFEKIPRQNSLFVSLALAGEDRESVFISRPVRELLFEGFSQPSMEKAEKFLGKQYTTFLQNGKFSFFQEKNLTLSKTYEVYQGLLPSKTSPLDYGQIITYDGKSELNYWAKTKDDQCNRIQGTPDGTLFKPLRDQAPSLNIFKPEICRSLAFHMNGTTEAYGSLQGYRFVLGKELLLDSSLNFDNNCFCPNAGVEIESCVPAGTLSNCREEGIQFVTTLPHFLHSEGSSFLTQTVGLKPNPALHDSFVDLEPITGLSLKTSVKLQTNFQLSPSGGHDDLKNVPNMLFPIYWTDEVKSLNFIVKTGIEENIMKPLTIVEISKWAVLCAGVLLILVGILILFLRRRDKKYPIYFNTMMLGGDVSSARSSPASTLNNRRNNRKVKFKTQSKSNSRCSSGRSSRAVSTENVHSEEAQELQGNHSNNCKGSSNKSLNSTKHQDSAI